ncbi:hypothetical protein CFN78_01785 [Amycolatopsis antarctica]|uniref:Uncharacterized protein n=1 Tax=Amycolatopsis antarctica TaxID=1854586 RepID=A0A263DBS9_9PSEU|nr:hypothetical protein CFN78_01785 [Amycolatopsis antarctica]
MEQRLFGLVADGVFQFLQGAVGTAGALRGAENAEAARLVAAWRTLLRLHDHRPSGRCPLCKRGRKGHTTELCTVWQVAVAYFLRRLPGED